VARLFFFFWKVRWGERGFADADGLELTVVDDGARSYSHRDCPDSCQSQAQVARIIEPLGSDMDAGGLLTGFCRVGDALFFFLAVKAGLLVVSSFEHRNRYTLRPQSDGPCSWRRLTSYYKYPISCGAGDRPHFGLRQRQAEIF